MYLIKDLKWSLKDCFYTFSSDFGPGTFYPYYGEKNGSIVTLWESPYEYASMLTLEKCGENWYILSHQPAIYHFTEEVAHSVTLCPYEN